MPDPAGAAYAEGIGWLSECVGESTETAGRMSKTVASDSSGAESAAGAAGASRAAGATGVAQYAGSKTGAAGAADRCTGFQRSGCKGGGGFYRRSIGRRRGRHGQGRRGTVRRVGALKTYRLMDKTAYVFERRKIFVPCS